MEIQERNREKGNGIFRIGPIRPPSEADSLLIQITNGCTWNRCKFCQLYRHTDFRAYSVDSILDDIDEIAGIIEDVERYREPALFLTNSPEQMLINTFVSFV